MDPFGAIIVISQIKSGKLNKICDIYEFNKGTSLKDICLGCGIFLSGKEYKNNFNNLYFSGCSFLEWTEYETIEENEDSFFLYLGKKGYAKKMYQINIIAKE